MKTYLAQPFVEKAYTLGEGPEYDPETGILSWVDIKSCLLCRKYPDGSISETQMGQFISAAIPAGKDEYVCVMTTGLYYFDGTGLRLMTRPAGLKDMQRTNDAKADPAGRLWFGTMPLFEQFGECMGDLYCCDGVTCKKNLSGCRIPNGMAWNASADIMYFIDSPERCISAFDFNKASGKVSNRREVVKIDMGVPDGMTIDTDGNLWVAHWGGGCAAKYSPDSGELLEKIDVPTLNVSSCCFQGENLDELVITTSGEGREEKYAGCVFRAKVEAQGTGINYCSISA